jgi:hypothetical protein
MIELYIKQHPESKKILLEYFGNEFDKFSNKFLNKLLNFSNLYSCQSEIGFYYYNSILMYVLLQMIILHTHSQKLNL